MVKEIRGEPGTRPYYVDVDYKCRRCKQAFDSSEGLTAGVCGRCLEEGISEIFPEPREKKDE